MTSHSHSVFRTIIISSVLAVLVLAMPARANSANDVASDVATAANDLYAKLSSLDSPGFAKHLQSEGFSEFNPDWNDLRQLDMKVFNGIFAAGAKIDLRISDLKVRVLGDATALVTGYRVGSITPPNGKPIYSKLALTMVWSKVDKLWMLKHVHLSNLNPNA